MLASQSYVLKYGLSQPAPREGMLHEILLADIANPDPVKIMLDYLYRVDAADWSLYMSPWLKVFGQDLFSLRYWSDNLCPLYTGCACSF